MFEIKYLKKEKKIKNLYSKNIKIFNWLKFFILIIIANLIFILIYNKIILYNKIYIPSYYFLSQTFYNLLEEKLGENEKILFGFYIPLVVFYIISFILNIPLFIFSYYKLGKKYTIRSIFSVIIWFLLGILFSINKINNLLNGNWLNFKILDNNIPKVQNISYYLISAFSGVLVGMAGSIIWKQQSSGGGVDFIYTYLATKKNKEIQKISLFVNLIIITFSIFLNEYLMKYNEETNEISTFVLLLISALIFGYSYSWTLNYFYPKFKLISLIIITNKFELIKKKIFKNYNRGGNVINIKGLFDSKDKKIIWITMTYLEQEKLIKKIKKIDPHSFFISHAVLKVKGNFKIKVYEDN